MSHRKDTMCCFEPMDYLFFGGAQAMKYMVSSQLPSPLTLYGALCASFLKEMDTKASFCKKGDFHEILGKYSSDLNLQDAKIHAMGPLFQKGTQIHWPSPAHLFFHRPRGNRSVRNPEFSTPFAISSGEICDLPDNLMLLSSPPKDYERGERWINSDNLSDILCGVITSGFKAILESYLFQREIRHGQEIDPKTRAVKEEMLYALEVLDGRSQRGDQDNQCTKLIYYIQSEEETQKKLKKLSSLVRLGGEGRSAAIIWPEIIPIPKPLEIKDFMQNHKRFILYLATPAIFFNGWIPKEKWYFDRWILENSKNPKKSTEESCRLVAAALEKAEPISGFQITGGKTKKAMQGIPRPIYRQVRAGSVYFFEAPSWWGEEEFSLMLTHIHGKQSQSELYPAAGFGMPLFGLWPQK